MTAEHYPRTNFVFAPPVENPAAWQASPETFRNALTQAFPDAFLEPLTSSLRDAPALDFEIEVAPDVFVTGTAVMPAPDYAHVSIVDVTADAAALFAQWLRDLRRPSAGLKACTGEASVDHRLVTSAVGCCEAGADAYDRRRRAKPILTFD
ncbi:hypothetical protein [Streptomyces mirabilis]|uniref:hypothetical protein n=1 Tax=Streptomyces mirabilis TaxID=68239 RepID=UPI0036A36912